jgi:ribosomal protein L37AE/L43A
MYACEACKNAWKFAINTIIPSEPCPKCESKNVLKYINLSISKCNYCGNTWRFGEHS